MEEKEIPKAYNPKEWEEKLYTRWEESGFFNPDNLPKDHVEPYSIVMPPPNANGRLHVGHSLDMTLKDIIIRFQRMRGKKTLLLPGADHAGFETQMVFEKKLASVGQTRFDLKDEELYRQIHEFTMENKRFMENDIRRLGISCDWSRNTFTLDARAVKTVQNTFSRMHKEGLVYRGKRIVNWNPKFQTSLSDIETEFVEQTDPFYYLQYGPFVIGTVRPETKFGDKYVVMHPDDERYREYQHGQKIDLEWINGPVTATVIKDAAVDREFGSGVMTITPWHDPIDFEIAERHKLEKEQIIDFDGTLLPIAGEFSGMKAGEARLKIVEKLKAKGLLVKVEEEYKHNVRLCERTKVPIEPQIKEQWFVKMKPLAEKVIQAVEKENQIQFLPEYQKRILLHWMHNTIDWNISRQIVWGISIPAWYKRPRKNIEITFYTHATTTDNENGVSTGQAEAEVSALGKQQIKKLKQVVNHEKFDAIFCSDLKRAEETAEGAFAGLGPIFKDPRLREIDIGTATGKKDTETRKIFDRYILKAWPEGESLLNVEDRVRDFLSDLIQKYDGKKIAIVGHQAIQLALDVLIKENSWNEAIANDWRKEKKWQPGWQYLLSELWMVKAETENLAGWTKDSDTFDTWFSSGQWPLLTLGYPGGTDFKTYYPTDLMECGTDLVFKWVPRMILFGLYLDGRIPFKTAYFHGMVNDAANKKMSKSKGNVISPIEMGEKYGIDALRLALITGNTPGSSTALSEEKIEGNKHFANKLWNMSRYISLSTSLSEYREIDEPSPLTLADQWILSRLSEVTRKVTDRLENYQISLAAEALRDFSWNEFADWYIEIHKYEKNDAMLQFVFRTLLRLWHPFIPFVTEAIFQTFPTQEKFLMIEKWPDVKFTSSDANRFEMLVELIREIRSVRTLYRISPTQELDIIVRSGAILDVLKENEAFFKRFARMKTIRQEKMIPPQSISVHGALMSAYILLEGIVDIEKERKRLAGEKENLENYQKNIQKRLADENFTGKAPQEVIEQNQTSLRETEQKISEIDKALASLT